MNESNIYENPDPEIIQAFKSHPNPRTLNDFVEMWSMPTPNILAEVFKMKEKDDISTKSAYDLLEHIRELRKKYITEYINDNEDKVKELLK